MGHQRLGTIPKTKKWTAVVDEVLGGNGLGQDDIARIAASTLDAAGTALEKGQSDAGVAYTFFLLSQIALAARHEDWREALEGAGITLPPDASLFDLTLSLQAAVDRYIASHARPTDVSEMAQQAAGEALSSLAGSSAMTLFGSGEVHLQAAIRELSTRKGFSLLGQTFFGRFLSSFLGFYLSRITAKHVGSHALPTVADVGRFNEGLRAHCQQSARIARDFCGQWYSKTAYMGGIDPAKTTRFMAVALRKLTRELAKQRAER